MNRHTFLFLTGKDTAPQSQDVVGILFHIDRHVAVKSGRSSGKGFKEKMRFPGIHLVC
jgi:hypothetical protein